MYVVQKMLSRNISEPVRNALTILTMQLCEFRIQFNICGLFRLEQSFISIAAAITTYLVVLLQIKN
nr:gustatory receptor [Semanotus bifasciatus]